MTDLRLGFGVCEEMSFCLGEYFWGLSPKKKDKVQKGGQDAVQGDVVSASSLS